MLAAFDIKNTDVSAAELNLDRLLAYARSEKKYIPLKKFPAIKRDVSLMIRDDIAAITVTGIIREKGGKLLEEARITDFYRGKQIPQGFKSLTVSCVYRLDDRTLLESEINTVHSLVIDALKREISAQIR
jgi:phenylalanyl-tRNA synthetase beta chain